MRLSDISVRALKSPDTGQKTYLDDSLPGFGLRISQGGTKTFTLMYGAKRSLVTIGRYPIISLQEARGEAKRFLAERTLGKHRPKAITFEKAKAQFLALCEQRNKARTLYDYTRLLKKYGFGAEQLAGISPHDINRTLERIKSPAERHHYFVVLRAFFNFAHQQHYLDRSPMERMEEPPKPKKRTRVLSDTELGIVLKAALAGTDSFSRIAALLALTGQRRGEIGGLQWAWINQTDRTISLPPGFTKNKRPHIFPYGETAGAIIAGIPKVDEIYVFPASREHVKGKPTTSFNGWSKGKHNFDKQCAVPNWTLHTLRKNFSTGLASLGVPPHVIERLLNHVVGELSEIAMTYNFHAYMDEMRKAINLWETRVTSLLGSKSL